MIKALNVILRKEVRQFLLYAVCGGTGVLVDLASYAGIIYTAVAGYQAANFVGYFLGTMISFTLNRHFTFQTYDKTLRRFSLFLGAAFIGYLVSSALLWVQIEQMHFDPMVAKAMTLLVVLALQFSMNRAVTFRRADLESK